MSRSLFFDLVQRSLRLADLAERADRPAREVLDAWWRGKMTRRQLLRAAAGFASVGLGTAACRPRIPAKTTTTPQVVIVGAGLAGLTAAYRLRQAGVSFRILEAQNRLGGRIFSLRDTFADAQVAELGGELIGSGHHTVRQLATELALPLDDLLTDQPELRQTTWFFQGRRLQDAEIVDAFRPVARRIRADLAVLEGPGPISYHDPKGAEKLDRLSLAEWLEGAGVDGWIRELVSIGYTAECGLEADQQSALNLLLMISPQSDPPKIFGESDERFHIRGGNDRLIAALADRIGVEIETGTRLEAIRERSDGDFVCSVRRAGTSQEIVAQHLVLTLPFTLLREVPIEVDLPAAKRQAIAELGYGNNSKLMVGFSERIWRTAYQAHANVATDLPFQTTWESSRLQPGKSGILTNFAGGQHGLEIGQGTAAQQAQKLVAELATIFPDLERYREGMAEARFHWPSHPTARGSYSCYRPGQWTDFSGAEGERVGRLYFAGEHCSVAYQGFMEGACATGEKVAQEILADRLVRAATVRE